MSNPNRLHVSAGVNCDRTMSAGFGPLVNCHAVRIDGPGHSTHIETRFLNGLRLDLDRGTAVALARALMETIAAMPVCLNHAEISGAGYGGDE